MDNVIMKVTRQLLSDIKITEYDEKNITEDGLVKMEKQYSIEEYISKGPLCEPVDNIKAEDRY